MRVREGEISLRVCETDILVSVRVREIEISVRERGRD